MNPGTHTLYLARERIFGAWSGVRPLVASTKGGPTEDMSRAISWSWRIAASWRSSAAS